MTTLRGDLLGAFGFALGFLRLDFALGVCLGVSCFGFNGLYGFGYLFMM